MDKILVLFLLSFPTSSLQDTHSLWVLASYIKGQTSFPQFSYTWMLDDVRLLYYNGDTDTFFGRGNTTNEDSLYDPDEITCISDGIQSRWAVTEYLYKPTGVRSIQRLVLCELDNGEPGHMFVWDAFQGFAIVEFHWYNGSLNFTSQVLTINHEINTSFFKNLYYPLCIKILKSFLEIRINQVNRKVKPTVRFVQKPGGSQMICLATGFYPRHINLTLFRDGQPVTDDVTGGDLLPNDDGTYQMRKILEIDEEEPRDKHKYTCTATHVSLDNKLDVGLEYDNRTPLKIVAILVPTVLGLVLISVIVAAIIQAKKQHAVTIAPVILWTRQLAAPVKHVNSVDSGHSNDSMIKE
ncbi:major histocompatibility complex class I-related gene protein-like [Triplophysa rosa]|uniref:major histocompatibility complex class I-related gene protein-like n=1 Tax=Triplophysa rosa TaxID=992332 RepID=UPI002545CF40|nr:major histocompatibility complex class I-related gene protein-like [Triplophysa rosa]